MSVYLLMGLIVYFGNRAWRKNINEKWDKWKNEFWHSLLLDVCY